MTKQSQQLEPIGSVAKRFGTTARALRFYEERGLLCSRRDVNGQRCFSDSEAAKVGFIMRMQRFGFTLTESKHMLVGLPNGALPELTPDQVLLQIDELVSRRDDLSRRIEELKDQLKSAG